MASRTALLVHQRSLVFGLAAMAAACDAQPKSTGPAPVAGPAAPTDGPPAPTDVTPAPTGGRQMDLVRVLAAEVASLRGQPGLAEMFLREVTSASPWAELDGWATLAAARRGAPVRQTLRLTVDDALLAFAVTPDGSHVAGVMGSGTVRLWTIAGGEVTSTDLRGASGKFFRVAISRDGSRVAAGGEKGRLWLWSGAGALIGELGGHTGDVLELAFRPDGQALATASMDGTARVWDAATAAAIATLQVAPAKYPEMPPEIMSSAYVSGLAWRPDGQRLATGDYTGAVHEWTVGQAAPTTTMRGHTEDIHVLQYSADGSRLLSGAGDGTARVWRSGTGALEHTLTGLTGVDEATFNADATRVAGSWGGNDAMVWDLPTGASTKLEGVMFPRSIGFSPDSKYLVVAAEDGALLWRGHGAAGIASLRGHEELLLGARFTTTGQIVTAGLEGAVRVWQVERGTPVPGSKAPLGRALSPDGARVVLDELHGGEIRELEGERTLWRMPAAEIEAAAYSPDGATIAVATKDRELLLIRARSGELLRRSTLETGGIHKLGFRPDGGLATLSLFEVIVWSPTGEQLAALRAPDGALHRTMAWSPDGAQLALANERHEVSLWRVGDAAPDRTMSMADAARKPFYWLEALAWSPDGARLAVGSTRGDVFEWDVATQRPLARWAGDPINDNYGVRYSPDGAQIEVSDIGLERYTFPSVRDPATILAALWQVNPSCPSPAERQRWLHLDADAAARDHARCERLLGCVRAGEPLADCRS